MTTSTEAARLDDPYGLPEDSPAQLDRDGFVRLRGVLDPRTVAAFEPAITGKVIELNTMHLPLAERSTYDRAFLQVTNLWQHSPVVERFVRSRRLARIAAELLGVDGVRVYHDQALYKEPGGGITPWHADQYYWPLDSDRVVTAWVPLQDTPDELGPLEFARGSHRVDLGRDLAISDESERSVQAALDAQHFVTDVTPYAAGDVSYHLGWTFHRAGPNGSDVPRRVMTIIYMDADIRIRPPTNSSQEKDLHWMPGARVGEVPDTPVNPVLYRRSDG